LIIPMRCPCRTESPTCRSLTTRSGEKTGDLMDGEVQLVLAKAMRFCSLSSETCGLNAG
jgi:hypothetical protein